MKPPPRPALLVLLAATMAACEHPAVGASPARSPVAAAPPSVAPPAVGEGAGVAEGRATLDAFRRRFEATAGFEAEVTSASEGTWDDGRDAGVRRTTRNRVRLAWRKPHRIQAEMLEAPFALMVGGTMETTDGRTLTLRPKGVLAIVALTVGATDVKLRNARNHTFRDANPAAQLARLAGATAAWRVVDRTPERLTVEVAGVRRLDPGIERETLALGAVDLGPRAITMEAAGRPAASIAFSKFRWR